MAPRVWHILVGSPLELIHEMKCIGRTSSSLFETDLRSGVVSVLCRQDMFGGAGRQSLHNKVKFEDKMEPIQDICWELDFSQLRDNERGADEYLRLSPSPNPITMCIYS